MTQKFTTKKKKKNQVDGCTTMSMGTHTNVSSLGIIRSKELGV